MFKRLTLFVLFSSFSYLNVTDIEAGINDIGRYTSSQVKSCSYCISVIITGSFLCTTCNINTADCFQFIVAGVTACCTSTPTPDACSSLGFDPTLIGYSYKNAVIQPARPSDICSGCPPAGACLHAPQHPSENC